jgi:hypothetical protein
MSKTKFVSAVAVAVGALMLSSGAQAVVISNGTAIAVNTCVDATNVILTAPVTINLSKSVSAGYICRLANAAAATPTVNRVGIGACHTGGTAKARAVPCTGDGASTPFSPASCTAADVAAVPVVTKQVSGVSIFYASTAGGVISEDGMATTACNAGGVSGLVEAQFPQ